MQNKNKGFFDILFVLIMLILLLPNTSIVNKSEIITSNIQEIDDIALIVDYVIVDALADQAYNSGNCGNTVQNDYDSKINSYLNNFENTRQNYFGSNCVYNLENITFGLPGPNTIDYSGELKITCNKRNNIVISNISKKLEFNKKIRWSNPEPTICNIKIENSYDSLFIQLDKNGTIP
jgi:hypothetical protein